MLKYPYKFRMTSKRIEALPEALKARYLYLRDELYSLYDIDADGRAIYPVRIQYRRIREKIRLFLIHAGLLKPLKSVPYVEQKQLTFC